MTDLRVGAMSGMRWEESIRKTGTLQSKLLWGLVLSSGFELRSKTGCCVRFRVKIQAFIKHNMKKHVFYLHPRKCGGSSVNSTLRRIGIPFVSTSEMIVDESEFNSLFLSNYSRILMHGHISYIGKGNPNKNNELFSKYVKNIFKEFSLIMPTRHPANLVQSWMHYSKTRTNKILSKMHAEEVNMLTLAEEDYPMLRRMAALKQDTISMNDNLEISNFEVILKQEDEEENLHKFIDFLLSKRYEWVTLRSMQIELMAPMTSVLERKVHSGSSYIIDPPRTDENRFVFYYDVENMDDQVLSLLDLVISDKFSKVYRCTRTNQSESPSKIKASNIQSVDDRLRKLIPNEYLIYNLGRLPNFSDVCL